MRSDLASNWTWCGAGSCCSAVACRLDGELHLLASAYLSRSSHGNDGNDAYEAALENLPLLLLRAAPNTQHVCLGLDANLSLCPEGGRSMLRTVGPLCWGRRRADNGVNAGRRLRRQAFLSFLTASHICAVDTFLSSDNLSPEWTHRPYPAALLVRLRLTLSSLAPLMWRLLPRPARSFITWAAVLGKQGRVQTPSNRSPREGRTDCVILSDNTCARRAFAEWELPATIAKAQVSLIDQGAEEFVAQATHA